MRKHMHISLSELNHNFILDCVKSGLHLNKSAVVNDAIYWYREQMLKMRAYREAVQENP